MTSEAAEGTTRRPSVLLIDDDPAVIILMVRALNQEFSVLTATDGLDGYALLCQHHPDVVLLDVMMPLVDGWSLLRKIRANPAVAKSRVIVVTGLDREAAHHESARLGVHRILLKPIMPLQIVTAVREAMADAPPS